MENSIKAALPAIQQLRKHLHRHPELSGAEAATARCIRSFIQQHHPTTIIENLGGNGLAAIYDFGAGGPSVMIRCELDALPIVETNAFDYRSIYDGVSHKCGHDGHMAIVAGLLFWIRQQKFNGGKIILFFQPAEENGAGAYALVNDEKFKALQPDYAFALHNLPGFPLHQVVITDTAFSATVQSVAIYLTGKQSHASEPENGINPAAAIAAIINALAPLNVPDVQHHQFALLTPVHLHMGEKAYGISAGAGELHYTLRTWSEAAMQDLKGKIKVCITHICQQHGLSFSTDWFDYFPASVNDNRCNQLIAAAAQQGGYELVHQPHPFKFGEDFGWFARQMPAAFFGLGAGVNTPALHHADYDFNDALLETGINMFAGIISRLLSPGDAAHT